MRFVATIASLVTLALPWRADAAPPQPAHGAEVEQRASAVVGTGYLGSPGLGGFALTAGLRFLPLRHLAVSFDLGYGLEARSADVQDRWWLMPSMACVAYAGPVRLDFGAGVGLGATSGYASWSSYADAPFSPTWAYQLVPAVRSHVIAAARVNRALDVFLRVEAASLLLNGNSVGSRVGDPRPEVADKTWYALLAGAQLRLL
jgi:hypothetical protein